MTRNALKILACISMLLDHMGYILFPEIDELRYIGRLAMPIFAFFIGEGCLYTRNRKKYFFRLFSLGLVCQTVYALEYLIMGSGDPFYLNILLTFSVSILLCSAFLDCLEKREDGNRHRSDLIFLLSLCAVFAFCHLGEKDAIPFYFDYSVGGILLPLFAATSKDRKKRFLFFAAGLVWCLLTLNYDDPQMTVSALCSLIPLWFYNGKPGRANLKLAFYIFYPLHLAVLYIISCFR